VRGGIATGEYVARSHKKKDFLLRKNLSAVVDEKRGYLLKGNTRARFPMKSLAYIGTRRPKSLPKKKNDPKYKKKE